MAAEGGKRRKTNKEEGAAPCESGRRQGDVSLQGRFAQQGDWFGGTQARLGLGLSFLAVALLVAFGNASVLSSVVSRFFAGEGITQLGFTVALRSTRVVRPVWHLVLTGLFTLSLFFVFPMVLEAEAVIVIAAAVALPIGLFLTIHGEITSQLESRMTARYWTFAFEAHSSPRPGTALSSSDPRNTFSLTNKQPTSIIAVLTLAHFMVQSMEIIGLDAEDKKELVQARNHFLYRVRNSSSFRHRAIATELLFRKVSELLLRRTAAQIARPSSASLTFVERQFSLKLLRRSEALFKPLPEPLDPDSAWKLLLLAIAALLSHKRLFQSAKGAWGGGSHPGLTLAKHLSRYLILIYLTCRYAICLGKRQSDAGTPPRMYF